MSCCGAGCTFLKVLKHPPGIFVSLSTWPSMPSVVHVITGPSVPSSILRLEANVLSLSRRPAHDARFSVRCLQACSWWRHQVQLNQPRQLL